MQYNSPVLFIEINDLEFSFIVGDNIGEDNFKIIFTISTPLQGIHDNKIMDLDLVCNTIKDKYFSNRKKSKFCF